MISVAFNPTDWCVSGGMHGPLLDEQFLAALTGRYGYIPSIVLLPTILAPSLSLSIYCTAYIPFPSNQLTTRFTQYLSHPLFLLLSILTKSLLLYFTQSLTHSLSLNRIPVTRQSNAANWNRQDISHLKFIYQKDSRSFILYFYIFLISCTWGKMGRYMLSEKKIFFCSKILN